MLTALLTVVAAVATATPAETAQAELERGVALLERNDIPGAIAVLERIDGPLDYQRVLRLQQHLGVALAYAGRTEDAQRAFERLLVVAPGHVLPYTISPKATFVFERARSRMARGRATRAVVEVPPAVPFDAPIPVTVAFAANALDLVQTFTLCHRVKGQAEDYACLRVENIQVDQPAQLKLPPISADLRQSDALVEQDGGGVLLQLAVTGYDAAGNEVYRGPSSEQPRELVVGVEPPQAWYMNPWLWSSVGVAVVAAAVGTGAAIYLTQPTTARVSTEVR